MGFLFCFLLSLPVLVDKAMGFLTTESAPSGTRVDDFHVQPKAGKLLFSLTELGGRMKAVPREEAYRLPLPFPEVLQNF